MAQPVPASGEWSAPTHWKAIDFISDLHLDARSGATFDAWQDFLARTSADAVVMLGDLFEVWVGDDAVRDSAERFEARCADVLASAARRRPLFFMQGNRDFLVGPEFLDAVGVTALPDPTVLTFASTRWLLSHGDALCLDDTDYQAFRAEVRGTDWQSAFLARPLAERRAVARGIRSQSEARKRTVESWADVDGPAAVAWLEASGATTLIHGHTHQPAEHALPGGHRRVVLTDWDCAANPPRGESLRLTRHGLHRVPLGAV
jgi:UDP-2,3-diacylglucosamine hydrolase